MIGSGNHDFDPRQTQRHLVTIGMFNLRVAHDFVLHLGQIVFAGPGLVAPMALLALLARGHAITRQPDSLRFSFDPHAVVRLDG